MKTLTISDTLYERLVKLAEQYKPLPDDFSAYDYSGGNYDDAYWMGVDRGEMTLAAEIIEEEKENNK